MTLKAWGYFRGDGTLVRGFNVTSVSRTGAGQYTINFTAAMATTAYVARILVQSSVTSVQGLIVPSTASAAQLNFVRTSDGGQFDAAAYFEVYE
ncbi:hypothetical protein [Paracidovorax cattleyae]|uniref:Uncharacterized protein n=1 Tax=Paracidovorax cattleyae TaxID=80868 RepID=A0A1H0VS95_9BURK|nr:hypothetical protein [Paracidovorax cattleyae]AVS74488.1 hypothetical protein C8240_11125 [Paracidovorax cattleyae]SDP81121.1 hypothetical protein SAMN04489708_12832 [Paracidovorax cattleyae]